MPPLTMSSDHLRLEFSATTSESCPPEVLPAPSCRKRLLLVETRLLLAEPGGRQSLQYRNAD